MKRILLLFKKHQAGILLLTALMTAIFFIYFIFDIIGKVPPESYRQLNKMTVNVKHKNGTIDTFNSHLFNFTSKDDIITIHLPLDYELKKEHQSINFFFYNSVVKAYYKDKLLVSYGENLKRHMIGNLKVSIPVPLEAYGDEIRIDIFPTLDILEDTFRPPVLMSESSATFFPIIGLEASYSLFSTILVFSLICMIVFAFLYHTFDFSKEGTWLMALIFAITLWFIGHSGMAYMMTASEDLNSVSEYVGMYLLFTTAPLYSSFETERNFLKQYLRISGWILFGVFCLCSILYILPTGYNYAVNLRWMQALQIVMVFSSLASLLSPGKKTKTTSDFVMGYGLMLVAILGILEQIRIIFSAQITEKFPTIIQLFAKTHFSIGLIFMLVITLFSSYFLKVKSILQKNLKEKHLEILAYTDNLTNIGNRQYLQRKLDILDSEHESNYAVIFIDINELKFTNDNFGHEAGDDLIKIVASSIRDAMKNETEGFLGRNGGDEFICVVIPAKKVNSIAKNIQDNILRAKEIENPIFPVSISLGIASYAEIVDKKNSTDLSKIYSSDVIKLADDRMYQDKCIYKDKR